MLGTCGSAGTEARKGGKCTYKLRLVSVVMGRVWAGTVASEGAGDWTDGPVVREADREKLMSTMGAKEKQRKGSTHQY